MPHLSCSSSMLLAVALHSNRKWTVARWPLEQATCSTVDPSCGSAVGKGSNYDVFCNLFRSLHALVLASFFTNLFAPISEERSISRVSVNPSAAASLETSEIKSVPFSEGNSTKTEYSKILCENVSNFET